MSRETVTVRVTQDYAISPERVFDAWITPAQASRFLFATPMGIMLRAEIDPRPGGKFSFTERRGDEEVEHVGTYEVMDRGHRLVFSFCVPKYTSEPTRVILDFAALVEGCAVTLTHEGVWAEYEVQTRKGWAGILESLEQVLLE